MNKKTRLSALILAFVMVAAMFAAFPKAVTEAAAEATIVGKTIPQSDSDIKTPPDITGTFRAEGPSEVAVGDEFQIRFIFTYDIYEKYNKYPHAFAIEFFTDRRFMIVDREKTVHVVGGAPEWDTDLCNYRNSGEQATDMSKPAIADIELGANNDYNDLSIRDGLTTTVTCVAVAAGVAPIDIMYAQVGNASEVDGPRVNMEYGDPEKEVTTNMFNITITDSSAPPPASTTVSKTYQHLMEDLEPEDITGTFTVESPSEVAVGDEFQITFTYVYDIYEKYNKCPRAFDFEFFIDRRYIIADRSKAVLVVGGDPGWDEELCLYHEGGEPATDLSTPAPTSICVGSSIDFDDPTTQSGFTSIVTCRAVAPGVVHLDFVYAQIQNLPPPNRVYMFFGDAAGETATPLFDITVVEGSAPPPVEKHTVTFKDWNGTVLKTEQVEDGGSAAAPADPVREGYTFTGWDVAFTNVTADLTVTAQYTENAPETVKVTFKGWDGTVLLETDVAKGGSAAPPAPPEREYYDFDHWDGNYTNVQQDETVTAVYKIRTATITFVVEPPLQTTGATVYTKDCGTPHSAITPPVVTSGNSAYVFDHWEPAYVADDSPIVANETYRAVKKSTGASVSVTFTCGANGTLADMSGGEFVVYPAGQSFSIEAASGIKAGESFVAPMHIPDENYHFDGWYKDGSPYDFNSILDTDIVLEARFALNIITITSFVPAEGSGNVYGKLYTTLNYGVVPDNYKITVFCQTSSGQTAIALNQAFFEQDTGGSYIRMPYPTGQYNAFDVYFSEDFIDFAAEDWGVLDVFQVKNSGGNY